MRRTTRHIPRLFIGIRPSGGKNDPCRAIKELHENLPGQLDPQMASSQNPSQACEIKTLTKYFVGRAERPALCILRDGATRAASGVAQQRRTPRRSTAECQR